MVGCIELLQERIRAYEATLRKDETRTRMALIDPLLTALGWDVNDPSLVRPEYKVVDGKADYALLRTEDSPAAIIEAKRLGTVLDDKIRHQMLTYATFVGIKYAGVTDGDHWELYEVLRAGPLKERQALKVSIAADPAYASALKLLLLWRPNLSSGEPVKANEPILTAVPVEPTGPPPEDMSRLEGRLDGLEKQSGTGSGRGRASVYSGKIIVAKHTDDEGNLVNPRREGSFGESSYNIVLEAPDNRISYEDYKKAGGRNNDLKWDYDHDFVDIVDPVA